MSRKYSKTIFKRKINEYISSRIQQGVPTSIAGLANYMNMSLEELEEVVEAKGFRKEYNMAKQEIEDSYIRNALKNKYNPTFTAFLLKTRHGYDEKKETNLGANITIINDLD